MPVNNVYLRNGIMITEVCVRVCCGGGCADSVQSPSASEINEDAVTR